MNHVEGTFKGARDAEVYYQAWLPEEPVKAVLLVVHGLAEHCGRYGNVVDHFIPLGYAVYGLDHIGHGKSEGRRVYVKRFEDFTDTLSMYFAMVKGRQADAPIFLLGHSMGGLIASCYLLDHQADFKGAVISGPAVKVTVSPFTFFIGKILSFLAPKAGLVQLEASGVSKDPVVVEAYVNDPLVFNGKVTARLAAELLKAMQRVEAEAGQITLPFVVVQGSEDTLVDPAGAHTPIGANARVYRTPRSARPSRRGV